MQEQMTGDQYLNRIKGKDQNYLMLASVLHKHTVAYTCAPAHKHMYLLLMLKDQFLQFSQNDLPLLCFVFFFFPLHKICALNLSSLFIRALPFSTAWIALLSITSRGCVCASALVLWLAYWVPTHNGWKSAALVLSISPWEFLLVPVLHSMIVFMVCFLECLMCSPYIKLMNSFSRSHVSQIWWDPRYNFFCAYTWTKASFMETY